MKCSAIVVGPFAQPFVPLHRGQQLPDLIRLRITPAGLQVDAWIANPRGLEDVVTGPRSPRLAKEVRGDSEGVRESDTGGVLPMSVNSFAIRFGDAGIGRNMILEMILSSSPSRQPNRTLSQIAPVPGSGRHRPDVRTTSASPRRGGVAEQTRTEWQTPIAQRIPRWSVSPTTP